MWLSAPILSKTIPSSAWAAVLPVCLFFISLNNSSPPFLRSSIVVFPFFKISSPTLGASFPKLLKKLIVLFIRPPFEKELSIKVKFEINIIKKIVPPAPVGSRQSDGEFAAWFYRMYVHDLDENWFALSPQGSCT